MRHPASVLAIALGVAAVSVWLTLTRLAFETSELHLLPPGQGFVTRYREYSRAFGELDELVIVIRGRTVEDARAFAARLAGALRAGPIAFNHLAYRVAPEDLAGRALLYLPLPELTRLREDVYDHQAFIESFAAKPGLLTLLDGVNHQLAAAFVTRFLDLGLADDGRDTGDLQFLTALVTQMRDAITRPGGTATPWGSMLPLADGEENAGYFQSDDKRLLYLLADPIGGSGGFTNDAAAVDEIRQQIARLRAEFPGVEAGVTGGPALATDGMRAAFADSQLATGLAFVLTLGLLLLAFRRLREPIIMLVVLALSLTWSLGLVTVTVGHLTVFSVMFISIVVGLGIDYGIYVLYRFDEERRRPTGSREALERTAARTGPGIFLGALTGTATFYVLLATDFRGVQELGFIAGTALLAAFVAMLTVFPALLALLHRDSAEAPSPAADATTVPAAATTVPLVERLTRHPVAVLVVAGGLTLLAVWSARRVEFDYDVLNLQARGTESVAWERRITQAQGRSSYAALSTAGSLPELERKRAALARLPSVAVVESALMLLPDDQAAKARIVRDVAAVIAPLREGSTPPLDVARLERALHLLERRLDIAGAEGGGGAVERLRGRLAELLRTVEEAGAARTEVAWTRYQAVLDRDFTDKLRSLRRNLDPRLVTFADIPSEVRRKFISDRGEYLLQVYPKVDVWTREGAIRFVTELRSVDADVTGTPVITFESIRRMDDAWRRGGLLAVLLVAGISALMLRSRRETVLALMPLVLGTLWAIGMLALFGLKLNLANVWGVPLIIGASAEYGLNLITRAREARVHGGPRFPRSTILAVTFNGLTTITGFGTLMLAHHRGMWSLGLLLTLGSLTSLVASIVVLPVLARFIDPGPEGDSGPANPIAHVGHAAAESRALIGTDSTT